MASNTKKEKKKDPNEINEITFDKLGLTVRDITDDIAKKYKVKSGIFVKDVQKFSKAANQRLFAGLVIVEVDKKNIDSVDDFEDIIKSKEGDAVLLKVQDQGGNTSFIGLEIPN